MHLILARKNVSGGLRKDLDTILKPSVSRAEESEMAPRVAEVMVEAVDEVSGEAVREDDEAVLSPSISFQLG